jgi:uncharacterized protein YdeI (YjbR/CyaY-like superfamily)
MNKDLDAYFENLKIYKEEALLLRKISIDCGLIEEKKWGGPVYTFNGKNIIGLAVFKNYCGLWFYKGAALADKLNVLVSASEKTHTQKQWRFTNKNEIIPKNVKSYIKEAIQIENDGVVLTTKVTKPLIIDQHLQHALNNDIKLSDAWSKLSLFCKREYTEYINEAKKEETKLNRLAKIIPMILTSKGLNDKYR